MRYALLLLLAGCGLPDAPGVLLQQAQSHSAAGAPLPVACEEDSLLCTPAGVLLCAHGRHVPLELTECHRLAANPRRTDSHFLCLQGGAGYEWCPTQSGPQR